jgi:hypothetical protein
MEISNENDIMWYLSYTWPRAAVNNTTIIAHTCMNVWLVDLIFNFIFLIYKLCRWNSTLHNRTKANVHNEIQYMTTAGWPQKRIANYCGRERHNNASIIWAAVSFLATGLNSQTTALELQVSFFPEDLLIVSKTGSYNFALYIFCITRLINNF